MTIIILNNNNDNNKNDSNNNNIMMMVSTVIMMMRNILTIQHDKFKYGFLKIKYPSNAFYFPGLISLYFF